MPKNLLNDEELKQLVLGSEYLSGTGERKEFDHHVVLKESDDLLRTLFFQHRQGNHGHRVLRLFDPGVRTE